MKPQKTNDFRERNDLKSQITLPWIYSFDNVRHLKYTTEPRSLKTRADMLSCPASSSADRSTPPDDGFP